MASTDDTPDTLPIPAEPPRTYVRIQPTADTLTPDTVEAHIRRLHGLKRSGDDASFFTRLRGRHTIPTIEVLLVSSGGDDPTIEYYLSVDDEQASETLEQILRGLFPDSYELETIE